jgi:ribosomal subunit interface protein
VDIVVKGRHTEVSERFRRHAEEKLSKAEKLSAKIIRIDVEVSKEHNPRLSEICDRVELTIRSRGPVIRAEAAADDPYAALDKAYARLEARLRKAADRRRVHHGGKTPVSLATATAVVDNGSENGVPALATEQPGGDVTTGTASDLGRDLGIATDDGDDVSGGVISDGPLVIREKVHQAVPMTLDQALYEMELVGHDFFLFVDAKSQAPSVVYRRRAYDYGVIRLDLDSAVDA